MHIKLQALPAWLPIWLAKAICPANSLVKGILEAEPLRSTQKVI